jgi:DNA polymerase I-like protein with 3'-5' exonuclease and polymerase domains
MERAGSLLDVAGVKSELEAQQMRKQELVQSVLKYVPAELTETFNLNSNDHLSCLLYGGTIIEEVRLPVGVFKTGPKTGMPRYKVHLYEHELPKRFEPIRNSEMKKAGYWSTSEDNLLKIKAKKEGRQLLDNIIEIGKIEKLIGSYLVKFPQMLLDYRWDDGCLHGTYSHGITLTSRLASNSPNLQNAPPVMKKYITSRFA